MQPDILTLAAPTADRRIAYGAGPQQFGDLWLPAGGPPHPVVIVIHGGFWRAAYTLDHAGHLCEALRQEGTAVWSLEYARLGQGGGGWPGTFDDVRSGAIHLGTIAREAGLDTGRIVICGHSAGGHLALWLAGQKRIAARAVTALAPVADLRRAWELRLSNGVVGELMGGSPEEQAGRYREASPFEMLPLEVPVRILHGAEDRVVPVEISRRFQEAAQSAGDDARLTVLPRAGHFELIDPRTREWAAVRETILTLLR